jgi:hypothetical protein
MSLGPTRRALYEEWATAIGVRLNREDAMPAIEASE